MALFHPTDTGKVEKPKVDADVVEVGMLTSENSGINADDLNDAIATVATVTFADDTKPGEEASLSGKDAVQAALGEGGLLIFSFLACKGEDFYCFHFRLFKILNRESD